jgi:hypothetical protein
MSDRDQPAAFAPSHADYSSDELLEQAQGNAQAALIATVAFLRSQELSVDAWAASLGESFSAEWGESGDWTAEEFLDAMLTNYRSLGAEVASFDFSPERAEAVIVGFPVPEQCERFGVGIDEVARFHSSADAIAAACGVTWTWTLEDPDTARTRFLVTRASDA